MKHVSSLFIAIKATVNMLTDYIYFPFGSYSQLLRFYRVFVCFIDWGCRSMFLSDAEHSGRYGAEITEYIPVTWGNSLILNGLQSDNVQNYSQQRVLVSPQTNTQSRRGFSLFYEPQFNFEWRTVHNRIIKSRRVLSTKILAPTTVLILLLMINHSTVMMWYMGFQFQQITYVGWIYTEESKLYPYIDNSILRNQ